MALNEYTYFEIRCAGCGKTASGYWHVAPTAKAFARQWTDFRQEHNARLERTGSRRRLRWLLCRAQMHDMFFCLKCAGVPGGVQERRAAIRLATVDAIDKTQRMTSQ